MLASGPVARVLARMPTACTLREWLPCGHRCCSRRGRRCRRKRWLQCCSRPAVAPWTHCPRTRPPDVSAEAPAAFCSSICARLPPRCCRGSRRKKSCLWRRPGSWRWPCVSSSRSGRRGRRRRRRRRRRCRRWRRRRWRWRRRSGRRGREGRIGGAGQVLQAGRGSTPGGVGRCLGRLLLVGRDGVRSRDQGELHRQGRLLRDGPRRHRDGADVGL
mmetsp:Transcript_87517/g.228353  ORF Transcript_87517/g.228353 Transcript_87517/m.228353 type:complete len:216 (+) Transcript_87517:1537-2184(+)